MQIRPAVSSDIERLIDIDGTITSNNYLHVEKTGEGLGQGWKLQERPLRSKLIEPNRLDDEKQFAVKQIVGGIEDGLAVLAGHMGEGMGSLVVRVCTGQTLFWVGWSA